MAKQAKSYVVIRKRVPQGVLLQDLPLEKQHASDLRKLLDEVFTFGYRTLKPESVRKSVFRHLKRETEKKGKYDLILLNGQDEAGGLLFRNRLARFGKKVAVLPAPTTSMPSYAALLSHLKALGERPRVLLLYGNLNANMSGAGDGNPILVRDTRRKIINNIGGASVHIIAGIADKKAIRELKEPDAFIPKGAWSRNPDYVARRVPVSSERLSSILEGLEEPHYVKFFRLEHIRPSLERLQALRRRKKA